eukprot:gnl/TRDRNA2_/TRDRNA2_177220_c0_seq2.p2 gnl/TRDRNA2_/TRDRNA2_177220_c0~~gnl/TRDRNA2_/TRDRNA2_177220_c0_seq2.p2  ORF type:complete len:107 (+),score=16.60 gnl/TRDRNA2_/TRDRNA2_177220_c0_seq2:222-542(+)
MSLAWPPRKISLMRLPALDFTVAEVGDEASDLDTLGLSKMAWACAVLELRDKPLLHAIASESLAQIDEFEIQDRLNTLWAFADLSVGLVIQDLLSASSRQFAALLR